MQKHEDKNTLNKGNEANKTDRRSTTATNEKKGSHMPTDKNTEHKEKPDTASTKAENKEQPEGKRPK